MTAAQVLPLPHQGSQRERTECGRGEGRAQRAPALRLAASHGGLDLAPPRGVPRVGQRCRLWPGPAAPGGRRAGDSRPGRPGRIEALINLNERGWPRELVVVPLDDAGADLPAEVALLCQVECLP